MHMAMTLNKDSKLQLNFPMLHPVLNTVLTNLLNEESNIDEIRLKESVVDGYLFAADLFKNCKDNLY